MTAIGDRPFDARASVQDAERLGRRFYARLDEHGDDGLGRVRMHVHGGDASWFNRITRSVHVGVGGAPDDARAARLVTLETAIHELGHKWFDARAGWGGLVYAGSSGRLSEGLSQVVAGATLALEGETDAERAFGWEVLDPRGKTTPMHRLGRGRQEIPLSVTMDDVAARRFTFTDNGLVHVHSGVVQEGHLQIAQRIGMEDMARLTVTTARDALTPTTGIRRWAASTLQTAARTYGAASTQADAVRQAWTAAKVVLPG